MKRDELKDLGLDKDQINSVMKMHGTDLKDYQGQSTKLDELTKTNDDLNSQLKQRDSDISELKKNAGNNDDLKKQFEDLQSKYKEAGKEHESEIHGMKVDNALNSTLSSYKARNNKAVKSLLNMDDIDLDDKGNLKGANEQLDQISKDNSFLFDKGTNTQYGPKSSSSGGESYESEMAKGFGFDPSKK